MQKLEEKMSVEERYKKFRNGRKTIVMSSLDEEGRPFSSVIPVVIIDGRYYVFISAIAEHYHHLTERPIVDIAFVADESETLNPFATERVRMRCTVERLVWQQEERVMTALKERFNRSLIEMLSSLDFELFQLQPQHGRYVFGFGKAYNIDGTTDELRLYEKE